jgi:hypothetical protein
LKADHDAEDGTLWRRSLGAALPPTSALTERLSFG